MMDCHAGQLPEKRGGWYASRARAPPLQRRDVTGAPERLGKPPVVELAKTGRRER